MSIWVAFHYADDEEKYVSEQLIFTLWRDGEELRQWGVCPSFVSEYLESQRPFRLPWRRRLQLRCQPWLYEVGVDGPDGTFDADTPIEPAEVLAWASRWQQMLEVRSSEELAEMMPGYSECVPGFIEALGNFQDFARRAMADGAKLRMSVG